MSSDVDIEEVTEDLTSEVISEIESGSISVSQLSSDQYNWSSVKDAVTETLERYDYSCVECGRHISEIDDYDDFFIKWSKSLSEFDSIEAAIDPDNMEPVCSDCYDSSPDNLVANVSGKTSAKERFNSSLSTLEKTFARHTPSLFVKKHARKIILIYLFAGLVYAGINKTTFFSSLSQAYLYPFEVIGYIIIDKVYLWFFGILVTISGLYSLFEYYYPKEHFKAEYKSPRFKIIFILSTLLLTVLGLLLSVIIAINQGIVSWTLPTNMSMRQINLYISIMTVILSPTVAYLMISVVDSDKLTIIQRDLQKRVMELAQEKSITKPTSSGEEEPVFQTKLIEETIELMKEKNINYYGWKYGSVIWKGLGIYSLLIYISIWFIELTTTLPNVYDLLFFTPAVSAIIYLIYRKYKLEAVKH